MSDSSMRIAVRGAEPSRSRAHSLAVWSLLMLPALAVSFIVGFVVADLVYDNATSAGSRGTTRGVDTFTSVLWLAITAIPSVVGLLLARRARRIGERGVATIALVANLVVVAGLAIWAIASVVTA